MLSVFYVEYCRRKPAEIYKSIMGHNHSVETHIGTPATEYDRAIRTFIPGYEQMLSTIGWWLSRIIPPDGRVVDLGGGTGALTEAVLKQMPEVRVEVWDIDPKMLAVAQDRLRAYAPRVVLREKSFTDKLDACDAVIATISLHHIPTLDAKLSVYANIFAALSQGGMFLNGDCTLDFTEPTHSTMVQYWLDFMGTHGISETEGRKHLATWAAEDTYQHTFDELTILKQAGFMRPEVYWREGPFAVFGGIKA
jgi:tRNA (cmo5U34)-methyltransferase